MTESRRLGKQFGWRYLTELSQKPPPDTLSYPQSESRIIFDRRDYCVSVLAMTRPVCNIVKNLIIKTFDNKSIYSKWHGIPLIKISCNAMMMQIIKTQAQIENDMWNMIYPKSVMGGQK